MNDPIVSVDDTDEGYQSLSSGMIGKRFVLNINEL